MKQRNLDLFKPKLPQGPTPLKNFLEWSVKIGRAIVVVTELIVLAVFFARFKLDHDLLDLNNSIKTKLEISAATESFENDFRNVQERLEVIREIHNGKGILSGLVSEIVNRIPQEIRFDHLTVEETKATFSAKTPSGIAFAKLIQEIKKMEHVEEIALGSSRFDPKIQQYLFSISIELVPLQAPLEVKDF